MTTPTDPAAFFRDMLGQWEGYVNKLGGEVMKTDQFAQGMHGATAATMQGQAATHEAMTRWLAAANMPSRDEFADLSARLARIEEAVAPRAAPARPRPRRTRTAPPPKPQAKP